MTERSPASVCIRPTEADDGRALQRLGSDPQVAATCRIEHPLPQGSGEAFARRAVLARLSGEWFCYTVLERGQIAGVVALDGICSRSRTANLFYWLGRAYWGRGVATRAAEAAVSAASELGLLALEATTLAEHRASARVLYKLGFRAHACVTLHGADAGKFSGRAVIRWWTDLPPDRPFDHPPDTGPEHGKKQQL